MASPAVRRAQVEPLWKQFQDRCVHFNGTVNDTCRKDINYLEIAAPSATDDPRFALFRRLPCFVAEGNTHLCPHFRVLTDEEAQAKEARIRGDLEDHWRKIDAGICPTHNAPMTMRQVGRCVYASCGCLLYQGTLPKGAA